MHIKIYIYQRPTLDGNAPDLYVTSHDVHRSGSIDAFLDWVLIGTHDVDLPITHYTEEALNDAIQAQRRSHTDRRIGDLQRQIDELQQERQNPE